MHSSTEDLRIAERKPIPSFTLSDALLSLFLHAISFLLQPTIVDDTDMHCQ